MIRLVAEALASLLRAEWHLRRHGVRMLHEVLEGAELSTGNDHCCTPEQLCRAMDIACVLYFKAALCLQRSLATAMLLRHYGFPAEVVIGARILPFKSHAWVELNNVVVNDKGYVRHIYRELERC